MEIVRWGQRGDHGDPNSPLQETCWGGGGQSRAERSRDKGRWGVSGKEFFFHDKL